MSAPILFKRGDELSDKQRKFALSAYCYRFTRTHRPLWASRPMPNGLPYPVQFDSDADWLAHTYFRVKSSGDLRSGPCEIHPTWPDNPELRTYPFPDRPTFSL